MELTKEEFESLGFEYDDGDYWHGRLRNGMKLRIMELPTKWIFQIRSNHGENVCNIYPKSLSDLKSLISMLTP